MRTTERQRQVIVSGVTCLCGLAIALVVIGIGYLVVRFVNFAAPAIMPLLLGLFLALLFKPLYDAISRFVDIVSGILSRFCPYCVTKILRRCGLNTFVTLVVFVLVMLLLPCLLWAMTDFHQIVSTLSELIENIPTILAKAILFLNVKFPSSQNLVAGILDVEVGNVDAVGIVRQYGVGGLHAVGGVFAYLSGFQTIVLVLAFFLMFIVQKRPDQTDGCLPYLSIFKPETRLFVVRQFENFVSIMVGYFRRQVLIDLVEGIVFGLVLQFVMPYGFVLGFLFGFLNLIPVVGTLICLPLVLPVAYFAEGGSLSRLVVVIGLILVLQLVDQIVTTIYQGDQTNLSPIVVVFSYVFWGLVFQSFVGILLAVPLTAFCKVLWDGLRARLPEEVL